MIYLLAILWFAGGFSFGIWMTIGHDKEDFEVPSGKFFASCFLGLIGPLVWVLALVDALVNGNWKYHRITLFKARKHD